MLANYLKYFLVIKMYCSNKKETLIIIKLELVR